MLEWQTASERTSGVVTAKAGQVKPFFPSGQAPFVRLPFNRLTPSAYHMWGLTPCPGVRCQAEFQINPTKQVVYRLRATYCIYVAI